MTSEIKEKISQASICQCGNSKEPYLQQCGICGEAEVQAKLDDAGLTFQAVTYYGADLFKDGVKIATFGTRSPFSPTALEAQACWRSYQQKEAEKRVRESASPFAESRHSRLNRLRSL